MVALFQPMPPPPQPNMDPVEFQQAWQVFFDWLMVTQYAWQALNPLSQGYDLLIASLNFQGDWPDLTGAVSIGESLSHEGVFYLVVENIANVTTQEPSNSNPKYLASRSAVAVPTNGKRSISTATGAVDFAIDTSNNKYFLTIKGLKHNADARREIGMGFSYDDADTFSIPIAIGNLSEPDIDISLDAEFFIDEDYASSLVTSDLGQLGMVIPAGVTAIRIGPMVADEFDGAFAPISGTGAVTLTAVKGV